MKAKKRLYLILTLLILISIRFGFAQEEQCGSEPPENYAAFMHKRLQLMKTKKTKKSSFSSAVRLPIQNHVVRKSNGNNPAISEDELGGVIDSLNTAYAPMNISFYKHASTKFIDDDDMHTSFSKSDDSDLASYEVENVINIFYFREVTGTTGGSICGYAKFPRTGNRIVLEESCAMNGSTTAHELGHYFSLLHTHSTINGRELVERVNAERTNLAQANCESAGDYFCDTPADPRLSSGDVNARCEYTGDATDANGDAYAPDANNFMSYSRKICRNEFTSQQRKAIVASIQSDRAYLTSATNSPCTTISRFPHTESFESGYGDWSNDREKDEIQWSRKASGTPSPNTGPSSAYDRTFYIFTEASDNLNKVARLNSPCIDLSNHSNAKLIFSYHMYGSNMGSLKVRVSTDDGKNWESLWDKSGNQGNNWVRDTISLSAYTSTIKLQFKGTTGPNYRSDIAIDKIEITADKKKKTTDSDADTDAEIFDIIEAETSNGELEVKIYPNPNDSRLLFIKYPNPSKSGKTVSKAIIRDVLGKIIGQINLDSETTTYDISTITPGAYFITISNSVNRVTKKLIIK